VLNSTGKRGGTKTEFREIPPMKLYFLPEDIDQIKVYVEKILASGMLTLGEYTQAFENKFGSFHGVKHSVAVNSGTSALEIALRCVDIGKGDEVLVPTNTFPATVASVVFSGGKPVLTDVNSKTLCVDVEEVEKRLTSKTKAIIVVHIAGLVCPEIRAIGEICEDRGISLIEDAAHAHGSKFNGQFAGSFGEAGCFSFYPTKVMTTGEGGMVTTNNDEVAAKARILRDQGKEDFASSKIVDLGYNWRMNEISAAMGLVQIARLPEIIEKRNKIADYYDQELIRFNGIKPLGKTQKAVHNYYKYVAILEEDIDRDAFKKSLRALGVRCGGEVYWPPVHLQPFYQRLLGTGKGDFPISEDVCKRMVALPIYSQMTMEEAKYVIQKIGDVL
jgi:perosamine synthetase